ncbi:putative nucleotidyltransferase substrate binding domain-containing protein [uncultured Thiohalocapsa sp.]|uniref:putative nucleotidyltransferase substrate binding domain-containing protein n=1 Tax=uncultured Thiohalocapsa sp. TaxID=768990 RepID=UPI0025E58C3E|nr:putative nucleotidyltransferase substrate binding domain-containing protein [uncultured Thiohalocapsa sp.]
MDVELIEIREFLASHAPFDRLPADALDALPQRLAVRYLRRGSPFPPDDDDTPCLYILRRGAVEMRDAEGNLISKLAEGDLCPSPCGAGMADLSGKTAEDTLAYLLPCAELDRLREAHSAFAAHFDASMSDRMRRALDTMKDDTAGTALMTVQVGDLLSRPVTQGGPDISIRDAARIMSEARVSSLVLVDEGRLVGMITDRDLRNRCLAAGLSPEEPVRRIMTERLHTVRADTLGFEALITMSRLNVHHLPVLDETGVRGVVSTSDLVRVQSANAVYLVGDIRKAESVETLATISKRLPELQIQLVHSGATASQIGQAITAITDAITLRLLELAEAELGAPPVPYSWMAGGSQARREQSSHSDQDNALLIADHLKPDDDDYFKQLARRVNDGLNACGYVYCPGNVMASNDKWRQPLKIWTKYFNTWIKRPEPMALMLSSVFFDLRPIHDPEGLFGELAERIHTMSKKETIYIAYMAANALKHRPPLGFFRKFVLIRGGEHDHTFDVKHRGIVPIVDLARVYALSAGLDEINTPERLRAAGAARALSADGADNLVDAYEFIGTLRMRHQAAQLKRGEKANNFLSPDDLSPLERGHLKDAFALISTMQESLGQRYQAGRFA